MAIRAGAPVVPIAIVGRARRDAEGQLIIRPVTVRLRLGAPIETRGLGDGERDALVPRCARKCRPAGGPRWSC